MNKHSKIFLGILLAGGLLIAGIKFLQPIWTGMQQKSTSDAAYTKGTIHVGVDNWIGYFPLCSPKMEVSLRKQGYLLECHDDQADYNTRFSKLKKGDLQFAVATVDSYLLNGKRHNYPGTIISVLDESKGGDAIIARKSVFPDLDAVKNKTDAHVAFTANSPSEHLLRSISTHFGLSFNSDSSDWRVEADGSSEALDKLQAGDVDMAVLWEPDVSRALASTDFIKLIGTEDTDKLIVDILLVERKYSSQNPEAVKVFLQSYFETLQAYTRQPDALLQDLRISTKLDTQQINNMLNGVEWASLAENRSIWYGSDESLIDTIQIALKILRNSDSFDSNPLPNGDPYSISNRNFIDNISVSGSQNDAQKGKKQFSLLDDAAWKNLKKVGTLQLAPIHFRRGTDLINTDSEEELDRVAKKIQRYPNFRILVGGHTGISGDPKENLKLSKSRAKIIAQYLLDNYPLDIHQIRAVGYGSSQPLAKQQGESNRAYKYRLPRVEITLLTE